MSKPKGLKKRYVIRVYPGGRIESWVTDGELRQLIRRATGKDLCAYPGFTPPLIKIPHDPDFVPCG